MNNWFSPILLLTNTMKHTPVEHVPKCNEQYMFNNYSSSAMKLFFTAFTELFMQQ